MQSASLHYVVGARRNDATVPKQRKSQDGHALQLQNTSLETQLQKFYMKLHLTCLQKSVYCLVSTTDPAISKVEGGPGAFQL
jgi:hypothetical protein